MLFYTLSKKGESEISWGMLYGFNLLFQLFHSINFINDLPINIIINQIIKTESRIAINDDKILVSKTYHLLLTIMVLKNTKTRIIGPRTRTV